METNIVTREEVVERSAELPAFPRIVSEIIATLDDPEANFKVLVDHIAHDTVIAARVLSLANVASGHSRRQSSVSDIYTATSMIGTGRVREMAIISSIGGFVDGVAAGGLSDAFWQHSVAVGVCSEELARHTALPGSAGAALIAGLLHDVGQLWLYRFNPEMFRMAWRDALSSATGIEAVEHEHFGADHSIIGAWLAEHWALPAGIVAAIQHHHCPDDALMEPLVPLVHVAEVLSNALDLTERDENRVTSLSPAACRRLGLAIDTDIQSLFGRMEARSRHANALFQRASQIQPASCSHTEQ